MKLSNRMNFVSSNVNILRLVAACFVILSHSFPLSTGQEDPLSAFSNGQVSFGGMAVAIFFFLSGFYVTKSLYRKNDVKEYMCKRCIRIFPQLWMVVFLSMFLLGPTISTYTLGEYFTHKTTYMYALNGILVPIHNLPGLFENNVYDATVNGPLWTMTVEFAAYIALAAILVVSKYVFKNEKLQKILHLIAFLTVFVAFVVLQTFVKNEFLITVVRPVVMFFVGVLYCDFAEKIKLNIPLAFVFLGVIIASCKMGILNYTMIVGLPYIVAVFTLGTRQIKAESKLLLISYEMYLFGWPIQQVIVQCFGGQMNPWLNCLITLPIDILLAYVLYNFVGKIEKRLRKKGM